MPAGPKNKHNPEAINNNEYFTGSYSPIFMSRNRVKAWDEQAYIGVSFRKTMPITSTSTKDGKGCKNDCRFVEGKEELIEE